MCFVCNIIKEMCKFSDTGQCSFCVTPFPELLFQVTHSVVILCSYSAKVTFLHRLYLNAFCV